MLKNDDAILPLNAGPVANPSATPRKIAVIGEFARTPRYQGGGSSHITPTKMTSFLDTLAERGIKADFAPGFTLDLEPADPALESEAVETAKNADVVLMFLGLPEAAESEASTATPSTCPPSRSPCSNRSPPQTRTSWSYCPTVP